jgi:predicted RNA binding protein YcfA (HicA-like mRNA interferase family)
MKISLTGRYGFTHFIIDRCKLITKAFTWRIQTTGNPISIEGYLSPIPGLDTSCGGVYYTHNMNSREIIKRLRDDGWQLHHTKGDHHQFKHPEKQGKVTVPHPKKDIAIGTLRSIFRQAGWDWR